MIALLALVQGTGALLDRLDAAPVAFEAEVRVERDRRDADRTLVVAGRLVREDDYALRLEGRGLSGDLPEFVVWRRPWKELRVLYAISAERPGPAAPERVVDEHGEPRPVPKVRLRMDAAKVPEGRDVREGRVVLRLSPREGTPGPRLRAWIDPEARRVVQVASDVRTQATVITLDGFREPGPAEGPAPERKTGVRSEDPE